MIQNLQFHIKYEPKSVAVATFSWKMSNFWWNFCLKCLWPIIVISHFLCEIIPKTSQVTGGQVGIQGVTIARNWTISDEGKRNASNFETKILSLPKLFFNSLIIVGSAGQPETFGHQFIFYVISEKYVRHWIFFSNYPFYFFNKTKKNVTNVTQKQGV